MTLCGGFTEFREVSDGDKAVYQSIIADFRTRLDEDGHDATTLSDAPVKVATQVVAGKLLVYQNLQ